MKCEGVVQTLQGNPAYHSTGVVVGDDKTFYQPMSLVRLTPNGS